jgi:hypothetical protein
LAHLYKAVLYLLVARERAALAKMKQQVEELHSDEAEELTKSPRCRII